VPISNAEDNWPVEVECSPFSIRFRFVLDLIPMLVAPAQAEWRSSLGRDSVISTCDSLAQDRVSRNETTR
jgi:hypothetical protein